jgi:hypothetical protein
MIYHKVASACGINQKERGMNMQFVITAYDAKDGEALSRRMAARPAHLAGMQKMKEIGSVVCAGGMKNEEGKPIGSVLVLELDSRAALDDYLASEPYVLNKVWQDITVEDFNVVIVNDEMVGK